MENGSDVWLLREVERALITERSWDLGPEFTADRVAMLKGADRQTQLAVYARPISRPDCVIGWASLPITEKLLDAGDPESACENTLGQISADFTPGSPL